VPYKHLLVLTPDNDVVNVAQRAGVGYFTPPASSDSDDDITSYQYVCGHIARDMRSNPTLMKSCLEMNKTRNAAEGRLISPFSLNYSSNISQADFGTLRYQQLMLFRTKTIMELVSLSFAVIAADIDTFWLSNPIEIVQNAMDMDSATFNPSKLLSFDYNLDEKRVVVKLGRDSSEANDVDVYVTDDKGEVCGCFVYLNSTENAYKFWQEVLLLHEEVIRFAIQNNSGKLVQFFESGKIC
jgi:hypothetical protein